MARLSGVGVGKVGEKVSYIALSCCECLGDAELADSRKTKASIDDPLFHTRLKRLLRIVVPSLRSREAAMLAVHSAFLLARTGLSLYVAELDGRHVPPIF